MSLPYVLLRKSICTVCSFMTRVAVFLSHFPGFAFSPGAEGTHTNTHAEFPVSSSAATNQHRPSVQVHVARWQSESTSWDRWEVEVECTTTISATTLPRDLDYVRSALCNSDFVMLSFEDSGSPLQRTVVPFGSRGEELFFLSVFFFSFFGMLLRIKIIGQNGTRTSGERAEKLWQGKLWFTYQLTARSGKQLFWHKPLAAPVTPRFGVILRS